MNCRYLELYIVVTLAVFISVIVYLVIVYKENSFDIKFFLQKTIVYYLYKNLKRYNKKYYFRVLFYILILSCLSYVLYCSNDRYLELFIEIVLLIVIYLISDLIVNIVLIPMLKKILLNINFDTIILNKNNIFNISYMQNIQDKSILFIYPYEDNNHNIDLAGFKHLLWMIQLYKRKYMVFYYTLCIVIFEAFFFMLLDLFFLKKHDTLFFVYATIWMILVIIKIKELTGLTFFEKLFNTKINQPKERFILKNLSIKKYFSHNIENYTIEDLFKEMKVIKETSKQNVDYYIIFVSTVLYIGILTYAGWK